MDVSGHLHTPFLKQRPPVFVWQERGGMRSCSEVCGEDSSPFISDNQILFAE